MTLDATVSGLQGLVNGDYDQTDEQAFYLIGDLSTLKESKKVGPVDHSLGPDEYNTLLRPGQQLSSKVQRAHCHGVPELE